MEILQSWLNQKGDGAAVALAAVLAPLGVDEAALVAAVSGERKAKLMEELATVRKRAEAQGVSKEEWEKVVPRLATDLVANSNNQEEPR